MPKVRTSVVSARAEVEPSPRDRAAPAPARLPPPFSSAHCVRKRSLVSSLSDASPSSASVATKPNSNSNSCSTPSARIPLGAREDSFPPLSRDLPRKRSHSSSSSSAQGEASAAKTAVKPPVLSFPRAPVIAGAVAPESRPQRSYRDVAASVADPSRALVPPGASSHPPTPLPSVVAPLISPSLGASGAPANSARDSGPLQLADEPIDSPTAPRRFLPNGTNP
jgi:hypothetical protein